MRKENGTITRDDLYAAAFRYKKAKIWKLLWDSEVFAVKLKSGEIGYVCVMGKNGEYNALGLYIGKEGFESYRLMADMNCFSGSVFREREWLLRQKCLQAALQNKEDLLPEEVDEARAYAKKDGIRLSGKNAFPQFIKYEQGCHPWKIKTQEDMAALHETMEAAVLLADTLKSRKPEQMGIVSINRDTEEVPLFSVESGKLVQKGFAPLPAMPEERYPYAKAENQIALAAVKKLPKKGIWESELIRLPEAVQNDPEETPYYPLMLILVESKSRFLLPIPLLGRDETDAQSMLQAFAEACKSYKVRPQEIRCRDERTYALLKDFCEKSGMKIGVHKGRMKALDDAQAELWERMAPENEEEYEASIDDMVDMILSLDEDEMQMMPEPLVEQLRRLIAHDVFPKDIAAKLEKKLNGL